MPVENLIKELNDRFREDILETVKLNDKRTNILINPSKLFPVSEFIFKERKWRFIIASGLHTKKGFEIYYHFSHDETGHIINLHVVLPHENPEIKSLTGLFSAAEWIEREIYELLGIKFRGHPNLVKLLSKDNWPEGTYPYRKDFNA